MQSLAESDGWRLYNRFASIIEEDGRIGARLFGGSGVGLAIVEGLTFTDGTIEFDVRGKPPPDESYVGIAFHGLRDSEFDAVYFKPFNFQADDEVRRSRAVQYVSLPDYPWPQLRRKFPGKYESAVSPVPDPAGWFRVRIVVKSGKVSVYIGGGEQPCMEVEILNSHRRGWVALWMGNGSDGDFANLRITPE